MGFDDLYRNNFKNWLLTASKPFGAIDCKRVHIEPFAIVQSQERSRNLQTGSLSCFAIYLIYSKSFLSSLFQNSGWYPFQMILETAIGNDKVMQDFDLEPLPPEEEDSQMVKDSPVGRDSRSKGCVNLSLSTAVSRMIVFSHFCLGAIPTYFLVSLLRIAALASFFMLTGCVQESGSLDRWMLNNGKVKVLATTEMIGDIVEQIGGERTNVITLIQGEIDPHSYELIKGDDEKLTRAQVVFYNGLGLEHGASLRYQLQTHSHSIALGNYVLSEHKEQIIYVDKQIDPHIWMDILLWSEIINPIIQKLSQVDPEGKGVFEHNGGVLRDKMRKQHMRIRAAFQEIDPNKRYLVTSHDAFNYFTRAYLAEKTETSQAQWQKRFASPEGLSPEGQLSATDIQKIIDHLELYAIQLIFPESNVSRDSLRKIIHACKQKGLQVGISAEVLYGDAVDQQWLGEGLYLKMIAHDADVLINAWKDGVDVKE